jgi:hypothetical protein
MYWDAISKKNLTLVKLKQRFCCKTRCKIICCETLSITHCLNNWFPDGGEVCQPCPPAALYPPRKFLINNFSQRLSTLQGHGAAGRNCSIEKCVGLIGNRTCYLPACNTVSRQQTRLQLASYSFSVISRNKCMFRTIIIDELAETVCPVLLR